MLWAESRDNIHKEDKAYSLLGIFNVHMPLIYGDGGGNAFKRLREEIDRISKGKLLPMTCVHIGCTPVLGRYWLE